MAWKKEKGNEYNAFKMTVAHKKFLELYIASGCKDVQGSAEAAGFNPKMGYKILQRPAVKRQLTMRQNRISYDLEMDVDYKLKKLKKVIDAAIPDGAQSFDEMKPAAGIAAIAETNKMQGHYSAEKRENVNVNIDADIERVKSLVEELTKKYQRDY
jgi:hypothetical protein